MLHASQTLPGRLFWLALMFAITTTTGCGWFGGKKKRTAAYQMSPEERPLELPPDLDMPRANPQMIIPQVSANARVSGAAAPSDVAPALGAVAAAPEIAGINDFTLTDSKDSAFRRIGLALGRVEGVGLASSSALLGNFEVQYLGQDFLIRIEEAEQGVRVHALTTDGREITSGPATQLLAPLKPRLS